MTDSQPSPGSLGILDTPCPHCGIMLRDHGLTECIKEWLEALIAEAGITIDKSQPAGWLCYPTSLVNYGIKQMVANPTQGVFIVTVGVVRLGNPGNFYVIGSMTVESENEAFAKGSIFGVLGLMHYRQHNRVFI